MVIEIHECGTCFETFQTPEGLALHIADHHVINVDHDIPNENHEQRKNSDTGK